MPHSLGLSGLGLTKLSVCMYVMWAVEFVVQNLRH